MRIYSVILLSFLSLSVFGVQPVDTTKQEKMKLWLFAGFGFDYMEISASESMGLGVQAGVILNRWLSAGASLHGVFTLNPLKDRFTTQDANILCGHGGLFFAPIIYPGALVHATIPVYVGYGSINYEQYNRAESASFISASDNFMILKPGIEVELNLLSFVRIAIGGYYECTSKLKLNQEGTGERILPRNVLNGFSVGMKLRFGKF
jgi:hypothetical protein